MDLHVIIGLGNPGREYAGTRHNAGFMVVERLAERWRIGWKNELKFSSRVARAEWEGRQVLLAQPQTFMNLSGEAAEQLIGFYKPATGHFLAVTDDADLTLGEIRMRARGSSGGHHGLESIEQHLGTRDFARLRIGVGRRSDGKREISGHVLGRFANEESRTMEKVLDRAAAQVECWLVAGIAAAMNQFNGAIVAPMAKDS